MSHDLQAQLVATEADLKESRFRENDAKVGNQALRARLLVVERERDEAEARWNETRDLATDCFEKLCEALGLDPAPERSSNAHVLLAARNRRGLTEHQRAAAQASHEQRDRLRGAVVRLLSLSHCYVGGECASGCPVKGAHADARAALSPASPVAGRYVVAGPPSSDGSIPVTDTRSGSTYAMPNHAARLAALEEQFRVWDGTTTTQQEMILALEAARDAHEARVRELLARLATKGSET